jgi:hypothetical protein
MLRYFLFFSFVALEPIVLIRADESFHTNDYGILISNVTIAWVRAIKAVDKGRRFPSPEFTDAVMAFYQNVSAW